MHLIYFTYHAEQYTVTSLNNKIHRVYTRVHCFLSACPKLSVQFFSRDSSKLPEKLYYFAESLRNTITSYRMMELGYGYCRVYKLFRGVIESIINYFSKFPQQSANFTTNYGGAFLFSFSYVFEVVLES